MRTWNGIKLVARWVIDTLDEARVDFWYNTTTRTKYVAGVVAVVLFVL